MASFPARTLGTRVESRADEPMTTGRSERRLAAILFTDVVGYSRLISGDEVGTLRRLKALRREVIDPRIAAAHGRIVKSTGDGVLVEFSSSVRAVACAVAIQRSTAAYNAGLPEAQALHMRIGINLGDVVADADGDLYGDGVNVAARLEPLAEPGGLCISRSVHDQVRDRLPYRFEDRGKLALKNIARPIGVFALSADDIAASLEPPDEEPDADAPPVGVPSGAGKVAARARRTRTALVAGALVLAAVAGLGWSSWPTRPAGEGTLAVQAGLPAKPLPALSLVVLPFANLGSDPEQEFFVDGLTEDLTTDLSHLAGSFVIARNTAFAYKGRAIDVKQVGRDLGVRYALEGSVRRIGERIVLNAQLISTETNAHVWADRFEGERSRVGELQVEFVARLARSLDVQLTQAESLRSLRERPDNPEAADLAMRGWAVLNRPRTAANTAEARGYFEKALAIDPTAPHTMVGMARSLAQSVNTRASSNREADTQRAETLAREALSLLPNDAMAHYTLGEIYRAQKRFEESLNESKIAVEYDPNLTIAYAVAGLTTLYSGRAADLFPFVERAIRLSPLDPALSNWEYYICHAHTHLTRWDRAIEWCNRSVSHAPYWAAYVDLAACYAWTGRRDEAREAVASILRLMPGYTVEKWAKADWSSNPTFLAEYARIVEGLRMAGLPEN